MSRRIPDAAILAALRDCAAEVGHAPTVKDWKWGDRPIGFATITARFGSWVAALAAAGLPGPGATPREREEQFHFGAGSYRDTGCPDGVHPACLTCPEARCRFEERKRIMPDLVQVATQDWIKQAGDALGACLKRVAQAEQARTEAERIHAALTAYGVPNLPPLPWQQPGARVQGASGIRRFRRCDRCAVRVGAGEWHQPQGRRGATVCRDEAACTARQSGAGRNGVGLQLVEVGR